MVLFFLTVYEVDYFNNVYPLLVRVYVKRQQVFCVVWEEADRWMVEYNTERPHDSLGKMTPEEYAERAENSKHLL